MFYTKPFLNFSAFCEKSMWFMESRKLKQGHNYALLNSTGFSSASKRRHLTPAKGTRRCKVARRRSVEDNPNTDQPALVS